MSGVTEVRLYRNTVDEVPSEYTDVTAAVLNSSTKNHATGVKRYLDGITTVSGLASGTTYYFWVELIDARGNTAGPQPAGSYTTLQNIVPNLTSATDQGHEVTWSSAWSSDQSGWRAFNRSNDPGLGGWASAINPKPHWLAIELPEAKRVVGFRLWSNFQWMYWSNLLLAFKIQGSNEGIDGSWETLGEYSTISYTTITESEKASNPLYQEDLDSSQAGEVYVFETYLTSPGNYKHYRLFTDTQVAGEHVSVGKWVLLG